LRRADFSRREDFIPRSSALSLQGEFLKENWDYYLRRGHYYSFSINY
jgi:hypothetical protein